MWYGTTCVCECGTTLSGLRRRTEKEMVAGPVCMCPGWWGVRGLGVDACVICVCCAWAGDGGGWACRRARACSHVMISVFWGVVLHVCVWMCSLSSNALGAAGAAAVAPHLASLTALQTLT